MSCKEISADWAAQRIKGLSLTTAIWNALWPKKKGGKGKVIKTLIDSFRYPRKGPGIMWEACARFRSLAARSNKPARHRLPLWRRPGRGRSPTVRPATSVVRPSM